MKVGSPERRRDCAETGQGWLSEAGSPFRRMGGDGEYPGGLGSVMSAEGGVPGCAACQCEDIPEDRPYPHPQLRKERTPESPAVLFPQPWNE